MPVTAISTKYRRRKLFSWSCGYDFGDLRDVAHRHRRVFAKQIRKQEKAALRYEVAAQG